MNLIPFLVVIDPIIRLTDVTNNDRHENSILYNSHAHDYNLHQFSETNQL